VRRVEFDQAGMAQALNGALQAQADQLQAVYDRVLQAGQGKSLEEVKELLGHNIRATFGTEITDPELSACSEVLASGRRIEVRRKDVQL
jgi:hypothetical protein